VLRQPSAVGTGIVEVEATVLGHQTERCRVLGELLPGVCAAQILRAATRFVEHSGPEHELHALAAECHSTGPLVWATGHGQWGQRRTPVLLMIGRDADRIDAASAGRRRRRRPARARGAARARARAAASYLVLRGRCICNRCYC
jgi:hypothetical protein